MTFLEAVQYCIQHQFIFAAYRLPGAESSVLLIQDDPKPHIADDKAGWFSSKGFLLYPFAPDNASPAVMIHGDYEFFEQGNNFTGALPLPGLRGVNLPAEGATTDTHAKEFKAQVAALVKELKKGVFQKVVLSHTLTKRGRLKPRAALLFQALTVAYPNAFSYMAFTGHQLWAGATPEPLLLSGATHYYTASVAGTRKALPGHLKIAHWNTKERVEQALVTKFIQRTLQHESIHDVEIQGPSPVLAGNLIHLKTTFRIPKRNIENKVVSLIYRLHPTPAVCGIPRDEAFRFILNQEKHNRGYYSGFLGPVNPDFSFQLFVNLRCVQLRSESYVLYMGAGITDASDPDLEWAETGLKSETLLSVIEQISTENI
ncbi:MAG: chorismate-binding protein [Bacteroidales bacterium]|nr:chorismate-binding protein [Bacteroidales bacterium]MDD3962646.1 chorismate-binding protein [Bacteroidales bacterium]